ncbi:MAG: hypothetical protein ABR500_13330 [Dermatophilaceae bacterium]
MSARANRGAPITVRGGRGGISVALGDLSRAVVELRSGADVLGAAAFGVHRLDLWSQELVLSGVDVASMLARTEWRRTAAVGLLRDLSGDLGHLAWRTRTVVNGYWLAEHEAALALRLGREATIAVSRSLQVLSEPIGMLRDGTPAPAEAVPVDVESRVEIWDLASIMTSQSLLSGQPVVRVIEVPQADRSSAWILQIPGTQVWDPRAGPVAHDLTSDVRLMGHQDGVLPRAALDALAQAQASSGRRDRGDPVLVSGHSLGGIAAMSIAADPRAHERFHITHVVTAGAPVGHFVVRDEVAVLSLEHEDDVVHRADLAANPDRPNWTTVLRDVPGGRMVGPGSAPSEHGALTYRETARLASSAAEDGSEPSLVAWSATAAPFLARAATLPAESRREQRIRDYRVSRVAESRS